jgi:superfamily II DNA or RNA helicase
MSHDDERLRQELAKAKEEICRLQEENGRLRAVLGAFSVKTGSAIRTPTANVQPATRPPSTKPPTPPRDSQAVADKRIQLFRALFRGRDDVYAVRWENKKGKSGYSPACAHEWNPMICKKPGGRCTDCNYLPLTDDVVRAHLLGQKTIGIYPMLSDETCWFLAADFDKEGWREDARTYVATGRTMNVPVYLERSRSGNGAHAWIFFEQAVPAAGARKLGSAILTASMEKRHQVGLNSYDRLFPNQDTMPKGGFGNLIAAPLQRTPRDGGNSVFLNDDFEPHSDQWSFLAAVKRFSIGALERIVRDAEQRGIIVGVRLPIVDETLGKDPWTLPPSRKHAEPPIPGPLPKDLTIVRSNLLYLEKRSLNPSLTNRIIRLAAFQNPEFYAAQAMRLSTFGKPRVIGCAEEFPDHVGIPRGCFEDLKVFLESHAVELKVKDERLTGTPVAFSFHGQLSSEQQSAAEELVEHDDGVFVAPPGFGKTVLAAWLIAQRNVNTLVLVHRTALLEQWREQLALFLNVNRQSIGMIGSGRRKTTALLDVAMLQTLQRKGQVTDLVADYGFVIADECHHLSAFTFERIMREVKAKYVLGLTATPIRKDGHHPIIFMQCGPIRQRISAKLAAVRRPFEHLVVPRKTRLVVNLPEPSIHDVYHALTHDETRNRQIVDDIVQAVNSGRSPIVLTERVDHLSTLELIMRARALTQKILVMRGGMKSNERTNAQETLSIDDANEAIVILATGKFIGEGFDYSRLDTLFLAMPISWRGTLEQYVGRLHRLHESKREVRVYDYVDCNVPILTRMYAKRIRGYRAMGYSVSEQDDQLALRYELGHSRDSVNCGPD